jgi:hypothetical protein
VRTFFLKGVTVLTFRNKTPRAKEMFGNYFKIASNGNTENLIEIRGANRIHPKLPKMNALEIFHRD